MSDNTFRSPENQRKHRIENSARNAGMGLIYSLVSTFVPFLIRTLLRYQMGAGYLGLNSLCLSITELLNSAELGLGAVIVYFLYEPIATGDLKRVESILFELKKLYRVVGMITLAGGLVCLPFLPLLIKGENPVGSEIYPIYLCYLGANCLYYFVSPDLICLSNAYQRLDISSRITLFTQIIAYIIQFFSIVLFHSYLIYTSAILIQAILAGILRHLSLHRYFPDIHPHGELSEETKKSLKTRVFSMVGHQIDERVVSNIDNVLITYWFGLTTVAIYGNYFYIIFALSILLSSIYNAVLASIGNALAVESLESNLNRLHYMLFFSACIIGWATCCMLCLCQNFMTLWMGDLRLGTGMVFLFSLYFYTTQMRRTVNIFKNAAGMWHNDRLKPYIGVLSDLVLDIVLIPTIGLYGAILSSIISIGLIEIPWETHVLFRDYFQMGTLEYWKRIGGYSLCNLIIILISYSLCFRLFPQNTVLSLFLKLILCTGICGIVMAAVYRKRPEAKKLRQMVSSLFKK